LDGLTIEKYYFHKFSQLFLLSLYYKNKYKIMVDKKSESLRHIQLPNDMTETKDLSPKDLLVYVCIKSFMNKETKECFPSLETIVDLSGISKPTVRKSIDKLKELKYISVRRDGRKNVYKFNPYKNFEPFSYAFLQKKDLTPNEKAYLIATQQYMFKDVEGEGKISYSDTQLSEKINLSYNSITKYNKSLKEKGYLDIIKMGVRDKESGIFINEKIFHLNELEQAIIFTLQNHEDRISTSEKKIEFLERQVKMLLKENDDLRKNDYQEGEIVV
jgi:Mn-dependent DtxR family transcriptional regulator